MQINSPNGVKVLLELICLTSSWTDVHLTGRYRCWNIACRTQEDSFSGITSIVIAFHGVVLCCSLTVMKRMTCNGARSRIPHHFQVVVGQMHACVSQAICVCLTDVKAKSIHSHAFQWTNHVLQLYVASACFATNYWRALNSCEMCWGSIKIKAVHFFKWSLLKEFSLQTLPLGDSGADEDWVRVQSNGISNGNGMFLPDLGCELRQ